MAERAMVMDRLISVCNRLTAMMMSVRSDDEDCCRLPSPPVLGYPFPLSSPDTGAHA